MNKIIDIYAKRTISREMLFGLIVSISLVLLIFDVYYFYASADKFQKDLDAKADYSSDEVAMVLAVPVWNTDVEAVKILAQGYLDSKFIRGIRIKSAAMIMLDRFPVAQEDLFYRNRDIKFKTDKIGTVELLFSASDKKKSLNMMLLGMIASSLFVLITIIVLVNLVTRKMITEPLRNLSLEMQRYAAGDRAISDLPIPGNEIGDIMRSFNTMTADLDEAQTSLILSHRKVEELQQYLSNIIESMPSMLISINDQGIVEQWNTAAEKLTGIRAAEIMGKKLWETIPLLGKFEKHHLEVIRSRQPLFFTREKLENLGEGENRYFNISLYPLIANGISGLVVRIDDISDLEKKEMQLRQSQKMETVGTLAGGLAHDFNNVLGGIVGTISILKFKLNKGVDIPVKTLKDYVETIERAGQRAADMVQQLLTLSRKQEISFAPVDLNLTIKHVFKICSNTIDKSVELKPCYMKDPAMVSADPGQMEQVLLNLSVNAGHAMTIMKPPGEHQGGTLTISLKQVQADRFFCSRHPEAQEIGYWVLSVQDTGTGMDSKTVAKIFDPFFTTKEKGKGTGLGLAMVYNIVQQHKGFIDVYSEIAHGTTFNVYLPSIDDVHGGVVCIEESKLAQGEGVILVVDDEAIMRELAQEILAECGYKVLLAENGDEGVEVFRKEHDKIDMVLLDMVMPKKSGKEAFIEMKKIDPNVKVLLASGFRKDSRVDEILILGVKGFLQKPYTIEKLAEAVRETINISALQ